MEHNAHLKRQSSEEAVLMVHGFLAVKGLEDQYQDGETHLVFHQELLQLVKHQSDMCGVWGPS